MIPQADTTREERMLVCKNPAVWLEKLQVVSSCCHSRWYEDGWARWNGDEAMNNTVHHNGLAVCPSLTEGLPLKIVKHIGYTVLFVKVRLNKAGSSSLDHLQLGH